MTSSPTRARLLLGFCYAALAALLWSLITPYSREIFTHGCSPLETAFWRTLFGGLCFAVYGMCRGCLRVPLKDALLMAGIGGFTGMLMFGAFQLCIGLCGGATAVVLLYTAPAWVAVLSRILFKDAISRVKLAAIVTAMGGVVMVSMAGGSHSGTLSALGIIAGLTAGFGYAACFPFTFWFARKYPPATIYAYAFTAAALFLLPFAPLEGGKSPEVWVLLLSMAVITNFCAYIALAMSLRYISQVQSVVVGNIEPILGCLWVWLFFGENFTATGWAGCALIMGAVFMLTLEKGRR